MTDFLVTSEEQGAAEEAALAYGIDLTLLWHNSTLSYEERVIAHQSALDLVTELKRAGERYDHEQSQRTASCAEQKPN